MDLGIEVILRLFSGDGLRDLFDYADLEAGAHEEHVERTYALQDAYISTIDTVITFLQGGNQTLARQICARGFLPEGQRFDQLSELEYAFGSMGMQDQAKHLATLYLEDLSDFIVACIDDQFGFSRYAERLGRSANSFDALYDSLQAPMTYIDEITIDILSQKIADHNPRLVCLSVPFPGNLYSALRCGQYIKNHHPHIKVAMGGGFANTELRSLADPRVFEFWDYVSLDDGELPLEILVSNVLDPHPSNPNHGMYKRTFLLEGNEVVYNNYSLRQDYKQADVGTPDYTDLPLGKYISVIEIANPMHSLWSDGRWNKLTMAHGCYWGKCTFCDISLDYIGKYEPVAAKLLVDRMETMIAATGEHGFHFVDEAAPPALMKEVAIEILKRGIVVTWWTNIRFEKSFTRDLCLLLRASGCIAVSGGLEVASDRLLALIQKGVTVEQVAQVTDHFTASGIMVHAYLMYGYPTQTRQETIDSLEMVRQLFEAEVLQSGFWHQFALTAHSPVGLDPEAFGVLPDLKEIRFADNDIAFTEKTGIDHSVFSDGLKTSLYNYMHGVGFDMPLQEWFEVKVPATRISPRYINQALQDSDNKIAGTNARILWLGSAPTMQMLADDDDHEGEEMCLLTLHNRTTSMAVELPSDVGQWMFDILVRSDIRHSEIVRFGEIRTSFELDFDDFLEFWQSETMEDIRAMGLLAV